MRWERDQPGSSLLFGTSRGARREGAVSGYSLAYYEGVDVVGALVGIDALDIGHVLHHPVIKQDAVAPENVSRQRGGLARLGDVVHLEHRDRGRVESSCVLETPDVDGEELAE